MPSLTSQSCGDSLLALCLSRQDWTIYILPEHSWTSDRLNKGALVKADLYFWLWYTHELLVYCCIRQVTVKREQ